MPTITFIGHDGDSTEIEAELGESVMEAATRNYVPGIVAECGGGCSCATCHVYVDAAWADLVGGAGPGEDDLLECAFEPRPNSRLSCQILVAAELDGLVLRVPERQM
ncbi:MAG TPA: 2Fe-2S iron-sulfur cluster-binding protein [Allosphingosinicella sp.]|nr:2Fe-2S iron-sulfur cluster-binding protein [Allosphingosinicella sp.]